MTELVSGMRLWALLLLSVAITALLGLLAPHGFTSYRELDVIFWAAVVFAVGQSQRYGMFPLVTGISVTTILLLPPWLAACIVGVSSFSIDLGHPSFDFRREIAYHLRATLSIAMAGMVYVLLRPITYNGSLNLWLDVVVIFIVMLVFFGVKRWLAAAYLDRSLLVHDVGINRTIELAIQYILLTLLVFVLAGIYQNPVLGNWGGWSAMFLLAPTLYAYYRISHQASQLVTANTKLHQTRHDFSSLVARLPVGIYRMTEDGTILNANSTLAAILELEDKELLVGHKTWDFVVDVDNQYQWLDDLRDRVVVTYNTQLRTQRGKIIWVRDTGHAALDEDGNILYVDGIIEDITEYHHANQELERTNVLIRRAKQEWESTVDSLPQLVCLLDGQHRILRINRAVETWGLDEVDAVVGRDFCDLMHSLCDRNTSFRQVFLEAWDQLREGIPTTFDGKDANTQHYYMVQVRPLAKQMYDLDDPRESYAVVVVSDITVRKQLEEELRQLNSELEARVNERTLQLASSNDLLQVEIAEREQLAMELADALQKEKDLNEFKMYFSSMISHEFRTPLSLIQTSSDLLDLYGDRLSEQQRAELPQRIKQQVKRLNLLLDDIMTISKAQTVGLDVITEPIDLVAFCQNICEETRLLIREHHQLVFEARGQCREAQLDHNLLRQMITNLLSNAFKYSQHGSTVDFSLQCEEDHAVIQITDHGFGIPEEAIARLYEPFYRGTNVGTISGTGLGLTLVKVAVDLHNGQIDVHSKENEGTTFIVRLPYDRK